MFSGAGGLAEGFRQAGWTILAGADDDPYAAATFRLNFPGARFYGRRISRSLAATILRDTGLRKGELGCLIGGPPCQSFSYNNHHRSASDERARLFDNYLKIVAALRPRMLVMENVPGMLTIGGGTILAEIERRLGHLGYSVDVRILFAEDFGVPQTRRRVFVIAALVGEARELFPPGTHGPSEKPSLRANKFVHRWSPSKDEECAPFVTVWDAISDLPPISSCDRGGALPYTRPPRTDYQRLLRGQSAGIWNHISHTLCELMLARLAEVPEGGNWRDIPRWLLPAGMRRARRSDHTKRYGRLQRRALASTILTKCDPHWGAYIHPTQQRTISVREAARLQGFPDTFRFAGDHVSKHYLQVGNAVPPPLARAIAKQARRHL